MNHGLARARDSILTIAALASPLAAPGRCITTAASMPGAKQSESFDCPYDQRYIQLEKRFERGVSGVDFKL